ncbi:unnamed protein product, partial [Prorocentrum cordatum]
MPVPLSLGGDEQQARMFNRSRRLEESGAPAWAVLMSSAVVAIADLALTARVWCATGRGKELLDAWGAGWQLLLRRLRGAARALPHVEGHTVSALGTTAADVVREALPQELLVPLTALAAGKCSIDRGISVAELTLVTFEAHVEAALFLGEEAARFGTSRVARAQFHRDAADAGLEAAVLHRADVLLWALSRAGVARAGGPVRVAEVGVDMADCSARLLSAREDLEWVGVDMREASAAQTFAG